MRNEEKDFLVTLIESSLRKLKITLFADTCATKLLFLIGAPGSGKTTLGKLFEEKWMRSGQIVKYKEEIGGLLRKNSLADSNNFEVAFELALIFLEEASYREIVYDQANHAYYDLVIIDGGFLQNLIHLVLRTRSLNEKHKDVFMSALSDIVRRSIESFPNSYFLVFDKEKQDEETLERDSRFEVLAVNYLRSLLGSKYKLLSNLEISDLISKRSKIFSLEAFLETFGNITKDS